MAFRSYMLATLKSGLDRERVVGVVRELESMEPVVFVESVVGAYDLVATVETGEAVEDLVQLIKGVEHIEQVVALKVNPIPARERMWKNFEKIPSKARA